MSSVDLGTMIWPRSGTGADLARLLQTAGDEAANACNGGPQEIVDKYLSWGSDQVRMLQRWISAADLSRLVTTPRYWATVNSPLPKPAIVSAIVNELTHQSRLLREAADATGSAAVAWRLAEGPYSSLVVIDTNFWIQHQGSFHEIAWRELVADAEGPNVPGRAEELRLVVPIVVIDELDGLTHRGEVRAKASGAAKWIYGWLGGAPKKPATIEARTDDRGPVTIQLVFDPPGHTRKSINDDELVDRTVVYRDFVGAGPQQTFMLTYDKGAAFRASAAGLTPRLLQK